MVFENLAEAWSCLRVFGVCEDTNCNEILFKDCILTLFWFKCCATACCTVSGDCIFCCMSITACAVWVPWLEHECDKEFIEFVVPLKATILVNEFHFTTNTLKFPLYFFYFFFVTYCLYNSIFLLYTRNFLRMY